MIPTTPKKIYRLTEKGIDLLPLLTEAILWSAKHDNQTAADVKFVRMAKKDRESYLLNQRRFDVSFRVK